MAPAATTITKIQGSIQAKTAESRRRGERPGRQEFASSQETSRDDAELSRPVRQESIPLQKSEAMPLFSQSP